jgi:hypothetical protein
VNASSVQGLGTIERPSPADLAQNHHNQPVMKLFIASTTSSTFVGNSLYGIMANLIAPPDELLVNIALSLDGTGLSNLALSHPQFRAVAREGLLEKATVSPKNNFKLVENLHQYPSTGSKLIHIRLGPITTDMLREMRVASADYQGRFIYETISTCCDIV